MKATLAALAIGIATSYSSLAGPSWGFTLSNGAGFYWGGSNPRVVSHHVHREYYQPRTIHVFGPQYYRMSGAPCNMPVRNYSNAPVIVYPNCGSPATIVPRSWR